MRITRVFFYAAFAAMVYCGGAFALGDAKGRSKRTAEYMLLRGINYYDQRNMESAMESFMEVIRNGGTAEEVSLAREYLDRITHRMGGLIPEDSVETSSAPKLPAYLPAVKVDLQEPRKSTLTKPMVMDSIPAASQESLEEYVERKFRDNRIRLLNHLKKRDNIQIVSSGSDKFLTLSIPDQVFFSQGTNYQNNAVDVLGGLVEAIYFHPKHLIHIYPAWTEDRPSILDLQRATVLGSYLTSRGVAPERVKVEMEKTMPASREQSRPRDLDSALASRAGRMVLYFEELAQPLQVQYFFTQYLPRSPESAEDSPVVSLGLSKEKIDTRQGEGAAIELFINARSAEIAQWRLLFKSAAGAPIMAKEGKGAALESVYFDGRVMKGADWAVLPSGDYTFEAEALSVSGGRMKVSRKINLDGGGLSDPAQAPKEIPQSALKAEVKKPSPKKKSPVKKTASKSSKAKKKPSAKSASVKAPSLKVAQVAPKTPDISMEDQDAMPSQHMLQGEVLTYKVSFAANQTSISDNEMDILAQVGKAAKAYPLQRFGLIGLASPEESSPKKIAEDRVNAVVKILSSRYGVSSSRLSVDSGVGSKGQREVEISLEE